MVPQIANPGPMKGGPGRRGEPRLNYFYTATSVFRTMQGMCVCLRGVGEFEDEASTPDDSKGRTPSLIGGGYT